MTCYYAFNGDADGLCALQQLRLVDAQPAILVTGVKRDIALLRRIPARMGDQITVLDVSLDRNRDDLMRVLASGASVRYFDHHFAGVVPQHPKLWCCIEQSPAVCTSILVDRFVQGRNRVWTIVAAYGDNLRDVATAMSKAAGIAPSVATVLEELGVCLNYNAYGDSVSDLHVDPAALADQLLAFPDPLEYVQCSPSFRRLRSGFEDDMRRARALKPTLDVPGATMLVLPNEPWARRAVGVLANELTFAHSNCAVAILAPKADGGFAVSVRVPAQSTIGADDFCRTYGTGGGRTLAAGIDFLDESDVDRFAADFATRFGLRSATRA